MTLAIQQPPSTPEKAPTKPSPRPYRIFAGDVVLVTVKTTHEALGVVAPILDFLDLQYVPVVVNVPGIEALTPDDLDDVLADAIPGYVLAAETREIVQQLIDAQLAIVKLAAQIPSSRVGRA